MRILHLIDAASPQASPTTLAMCGDSLGRLGRTEQHALLLGGSALVRAAKDVGLTEAAHASVPWGSALMGWPLVRREMAERGPFDLIHCWSIGAFTLASIAWRKTPRVLTLTTEPSERAVRWLRLLTGEAGGRAVLLPISSTIRRTLLTRGVPEACVHVLRPGLDMARVASSDRGELRKRWGITPGEDARIKVVAILGDPPQAADTEAAHMAVGLADETFLDADGRGNRPEIRLLVHPAQQHRARAERIVRLIDKPLRIFQDPALARPWEVLPGCDIALAQGPHAGGLSLLWAMAANVPIVGEATYHVSEVVEDRHSALLAKPGEPRMLSHRITQLLADTQLAWKLRDTARHEAYSFFSRQRYCQSLQTVYDQILAGQTIDIPPLPTTGGLRFAGRA